jgi:hypothetical protein
MVRTITRRARVAARRALDVRAHREPAPSPNLRAGTSPTSYPFAARF